jgi:hypothetical protein
MRHFRPLRYAAAQRYAAFSAFATLYRSPDALPLSASRRFSFAFAFFRAAFFHRDISSMPLIYFSVFFAIFDYFFTDSFLRFFTSPAAAAISSIFRHYFLFAITLTPPQAFAATPLLLMPFR